MTDSSESEQSHPPSGQVVALRNFPDGIFVLENRLRAGTTIAVNNLGGDIVVGRVC